MTISPDSGSTFRTVGGLVLGLVMLAAPLARAQDLDLSFQRPHGDAIVRTEQRVVPLASVMRGSELEIRGQRGQLEFLLPLPAGSQVEEALLRLNYVSSDELLEGRSQLWVFVNDEGVAALPLTAQRSATRAEVSLPVGLLGSGMNRLTLISQQDHALGCDPASLTRLWTKFEAAGSYVVVRLTRPNVPPLLSDLDSPAELLLSIGPSLTIATAIAPDRARLLQAGGLVSQGFVLRMGDNRRPMIHHREHGAWDRSDDVDVVLGTRDDLAGLIDGVLSDAIEGPFLAVAPRPYDPTRPYLVVSGRTDAEVLAAAAAIADPRWSLPTAPWQVITERPAWQPIEMPVLAPGRTYRFSELSLTSDTIGNGSEARTTIELMLPNDWFVADNRKARIDLAFAYQAGLAAESVLNVLVNDEYVDVIPLTEGEGTSLTQTALDLPLTLFHPGRNRIAFEPLTGVDPSFGCGQRFAGGSSITIFGDSEITLPRVARAIHQPDLGLFQNTGFPIADPGSGAVVVADSDGQAIAAAWMLMARLAERARQPLYDLPIDFRPYAVDRNLLIVGSIDGINRALGGGSGVASNALRRAGASLVAARSLGARYPAAATASGPMVAAAAVPSPADDAATPILAGAGTTFPIMPEAAIGIDPSATESQFGLLTGTGSPIRLGEQWDLEAVLSRADLVLQDYLGRGETRVEPAQVVVSAFESPLHPGRSVVAVGAADTNDLQSGVVELTRPDHWSALDGDLTTLDLIRGQVMVHSVSPRFQMHAPTSDWRQMLLYVNSMFGRYPALWLLTVLIAVFIFASLTWGALRLVRKP